MKQLKDSVRSVLTRTVRSGFVVAVVAILGASPVLAQSTGNDARLIGMGGLGGEKTDASKLAGPDRDYSVIGLPIGLFQVLSKMQVFNARERSSFNLVKVLDYASNPTQFILNREQSGAAVSLATDLMRADVKRDLNSYRGFVPANFDTGGVFSPKWGKTFKVHENGDEFHGLFLGLGPYLAMKSHVDFDPALTALFADPSTPVPANKTPGYWIGSDPSATCQFPTCTPLVQSQTAASVTAGYRSRWALPKGIEKIGGGGTSDRDGIYLAMNVNYYVGIRFDELYMNAVLETDSDALITTTPSGFPVNSTHLWSNRGSGHSVDISSAVVVDRLRFNVGVEGIGNSMNWRDIHGYQYLLTSIFNTQKFTRLGVTVDPNPGNADLHGQDNKEVELPVRVQVGGTYKVTDKVTAGAQFRHGLQKNEFDAGAEYPWSFMEFRGGMRYTDTKWNPAYGIGFNLGDKFGFDIGAYQTTTSIDRERRTAIAASFRVKH